MSIIFFGLQSSFPASAFHFFLAFFSSPSPSQLAVQVFPQLRLFPASRGNTPWVLFFDSHLRSPAPSFPLSFALFPDAPPPPVSFPSSLPDSEPNPHLLSSPTFPSPLGPPAIIVPGSSRQLRGFTRTAPRAKPSFLFFGNLFRNLFPLFSIILPQTLFFFRNEVDSFFTVASLGLALSHPPLLFSVFGALFPFCFPPFFLQATPVPHLQEVLRCGPCRRAPCHPRSTSCRTRKGCSVPSPGFCVSFKDRTALALALSSLSCWFIHCCWQGDHPFVLFFDTVAGSGSRSVTCFQSPPVPTHPSFCPKPAPSGQSPPGTFYPQLFIFFPIKRGPTTGKLLGPFRLTIGVVGF